MDKINKYILAAIISKVGPWPEIIRLQAVCKKWKLVIEETSHYFTFQGVRHPQFIPSNIKIDPYLEKFKSGWKLKVLDLRNVNISVEVLADVLLCQLNLVKLDLTNTQISVGQVWSCIQAKKPKESFQLEELRITNNRTVYLGYEALVAVFPNLVRLYAGNTLTILDHLKIILGRLPRLQILDISLCTIDVYDMAYVDFRELIQECDLQRIFISEINEIVVNTIVSMNVEIVESTIGDILNKEENEEKLIELEEWLRIGGDPNLQCNSNHKLWKELSSHPQIEVIKRAKDQTMLRDIFRLMISYDLDLSHHTSESSNLLNTSILNHQTGLVYLLLSHGIDISPSLVLEETPSMTLAAEIGDMSIIQIFLDFKLCSFDYYSPKFCNPICTAAYKGNKDLFMFLMEQEIPLFPCTKHSNILITSKEILEMVLSPDNKENFTFPQEMLYEAAQYYIAKGNAEQAMLIIENMDVCVKDDEVKILEEKRNSSMKISSDMHKTLLILATEKNLVQVIKYLVDHGFDINGEDMHGWTAFMCACSYGHMELIPYFCDNGALVNKRDKWWRTGLHQAAQIGHVDVVRELIRYGAGLSPECDKGLTPLNYAIINKHKEAENILREHGAKCAKVKKMCRVF